jgi:hypothetical protein
VGRGTAPAAVATAGAPTHLVAKELRPEDASSAEDVYIVVAVPMLFTNFLSAAIFAGRGSAGSRGSASGTLKSAPGADELHSSNPRAAEKERGNRCPFLT